MSGPYCKDCKFFRKMPFGKSGECGDPGKIIYVGKGGRVNSEPEVQSHWTCDEWQAAMSSESFSNAWLSDEFAEDFGRVTVLIDEDRDRRCSYAVCSIGKGDRQGQQRVLQFGQGTTAEVVEFARAMVDKHDALVVCDAIPNGELQAIARHFRWSVSMPKNNEFPAIGFICGLGR